ncbi:hypothetical protein BCR42DRAFT_372204 [Absidia repens]|uniref:Uncharacterized protein n=1 Tax=Absidia repens TaxID=90262 RepID=A0A1X2ILK8_9FUNG|nr:hypothetical protein BCR42DRAFT_372204 [Absidia repens]
MSEPNQPIDSSIHDEDTSNSSNTMSNNNNNQGLSMRPAQQNPFQFDLSFLPKLDQLLPENPLFFMQQQHQQQQQQLQDQAMKDVNNVSSIAESSTGAHPSHALMPSFDQAASNGSEANQSIWSGFNNFFSNVAHNPFPQSIPNLAKNVSEYFSNYQIFSSVNHQSGTNPQDPSQIQGSVPGIKYESLVDGSFKPPGMNSSGMQIRVLGVPQTGAKSRVETQIKICIQLVTDDGDKAQQWSHLKLPEHMVAKDKLKKQQQITVNTDNNGSITSVNGLENTTLPVKADKMLFLSARVICASDPSRKVVTCLGCIQRERKRSQRRKENKVKTETDDGEKRLEDEQSLALEEQKILLFNCSEIVDFSSGDTILPTRITCYCRHHNERLGFCIYFEMQDHTGKPVATGMSPPIMITDDHKSSKIKAGRKRPRTDLDKPISAQAILSAGSFPFASNTPPPHPSNNGNTVSPTSSSSNTSPSSNTQSFLPFNTFTDTQFNNANHSIPHHHNPKMAVTSSSPNGTSLINHYQQIKSEPSHMQLDQNLLNTMATAVTPTSNNSNSTENSKHHHATTPTSQGKVAMVERPQMQRMIPSEGPMDGGIEVTILGSGFRPGLTCMFGDIAATNTHYWSPNTLVCILPPAIEPGAVVVSFKEYPVVPDSQDLTLFTYCNENDRALMELALQVVGLKMTGKVEDARDIAMRIVEGNGNHGVVNSTNSSSSRQRQQPDQQQQQISSVESPLSSLLSTQQQQLSATLRSLPSVDVFKQLLDDRSPSQNKLCFDWPLLQMLESPGPWSE